MHLENTVQLTLMSFPCFFSMLQYWSQCRQGSSHCQTLLLTDLRLLTVHFLTLSSLRHIETQRNNTMRRWRPHNLPTNIQQYTYGGKVIMHVNVKMKNWRDKGRSGSSRKHRQKRRGQGWRGDKTTTKKMSWQVYHEAGSSETKDQNELSDTHLIRNNKALIVSPISPQPHSLFIL